MRDGCPFCDYGGPSPVIEYLHGCLIFQPLHPVTQGHVLVVPKLHVPSVAEARRWDPEEREAVSGAFAAAGCWSEQFGASNIIASSGRAATQTVRHLHVHVVPRRPDDGLALPWSPNPKEEALEQALPRRRDERVADSLMSMQDALDTLRNALSPNPEEEGPGGS